MRGKRGRIHAYKTSLARAEAQERLLRAIEHGFKPTRRRNSVRRRKARKLGEHASGVSIDIPMGRGYHAKVKGSIDVTRKMVAIRSPDFTARIPIKIARSFTFKKGSKYIKL